MSSNYLGRTDVQRGLRNNNPGNLVLTSINWQGKKLPNTDGQFEQFIDMAWGVRAMITDIVGDITLDGANTLQKLIYLYSPPHENNTEAYINYLASTLSIGRNDAIPVNQDFIKRLILAMIKKESDRDYYLVTDDDINTGFSRLNPVVKAALNLKEIAIGGSVLALLAIGAYFYFRKN